MCLKFDSISERRDNLVTVLSQYRVYVIAVLHMWVHVYVIFQEFAVLIGDLLLFGYDPVKVL